MKLQSLTYIFLFIFVSIQVFAQNEDISLIPIPYEIKKTEGNFSFSKSTSYVVHNKELLDEVSIFNKDMKKWHGFSLIPAQIEKKNQVILEINPKLKDEEYQIIINTEQIRLSGSETGISRGLQTLLQLLPDTIIHAHQIPCMEINDKPRFVWRGMHLDVCRHFFSVNEVKQYIDYLAYFKMNVFHWHLTDDQGWRIEIKKYPLLTLVGGWRKGTHIGHSSDNSNKIDTSQYGGFYTQQEIKEVVAYAKQRHITIVPEIEMPGHALAALAAYPQLSCNRKKSEVATTWGVFENVFCTHDSVFIFLKDILDEVMTLFPSEYIHIGGDECPKVNWKKCAICQQQMKSEGLKTEEELQSYFIKRIEKYVNSKGRKIIGWDEILEGGLAPNAAIMSWRGTEGGIAAAKTNHFAVMTPGSHCYFDHYQGEPALEPLAIGGYTPLEKVYAFEPIPEGLSADEQKYILGAQANLWTEYISTFDHVEYMIFPRICALSEVLWSPMQNRNYLDFRDRLLVYFKKFDKQKINYARSIFEIKKKILNDSTNHSLAIQLFQDFKQGDLHYTLDGTLPNLQSKIYQNPIPITKSCTLKAYSIDSLGKENGKIKQDFTLALSSGKKIQLKHAPASQYNYESPLTLVDGILGSIPWNGKEWLGFSNTDFEAIIDLSKSEIINSVSVDVLQAKASWIYLPIEMKVALSNDGKNFSEPFMLTSEEINKNERRLTLNLKKTEARYIKIYLKRAGIISTGQPGEGHQAWLFISEILID